LNIVVCVKQVPDTAAKVVVENGQVSWGDAPLVLNPWDEYAVEAALQLVDQHGGNVKVISMGDENALEALKHALAMGSNDALLVNDPALAGCDSQATARILAAVINKLDDVDLVIFGKQAVDSDGGVTASQTARVLGFPTLTLVSTIKNVDLEANTIRIERAVEEGRQVVEGNLPAVLSIVKDFGEPRYPSFMGIRKASRAQIPTWTLADLGLPAPKSVVAWPELMNPPSKEVTCEVISKDTPEATAAALADKILAEKVI